MASNSTSWRVGVFVALSATALLGALGGCSHHDSGSVDGAKPMYYTGPMKSQAERLNNATIPKAGPPTGSTSGH